MVRAAVFIGVDQTGKLQKLNDAASGAKRMHEWALRQGIASELITDAGGARVHPDQIYDAIKSVVDGPGADQLILYFAGHGVNIHRNEHWLLTDAPERTSAAVNVTGSAELARYCGIQHVVIISDACRVAPEGIQAQSVRGVEVFPNDSAGGRGKPVDQFFACSLGRTAAELRDPAAAAGTFSALYTDAMLHALEGKSRSIFQKLAGQNDAERYLLPRKLQSWLENEVPKRVQSRNLQGRVNQEPDAIITSDGIWLARIEAAARKSSANKSTRSGSASRGVHYGPPPMPRHGHDAPRRPAGNRLDLSRRLVESAADTGMAALRGVLDDARSGAVEGADLMAETLNRVAEPFGPDHFESRCGIKVRGARIERWFGPRVDAQLLGGSGDVLRIFPIDGPASSVLLEFDNGLGTVIPAIRDYIAALTFEEGELVDVSYEPSLNGPRWMGRASWERVRALRSVAASASQLGRFRLEGESALAIARSMQREKAIDPTLAVYAAYAYHDLQQIDRIQGMSDFLRRDTGMTLFDLELLARRLVGRSITPDQQIVPFVPLLAQGWALLSANRVRLHPALRGIEETLQSSLWSLYDRSGVARLRAAMLTGDVR